MNQQSKLVSIRVDGDSKIGLGHIIRCYALAQGLKKQFAIDFYCKSIPLSLQNEINKGGFNILKIENEEEFIEKIESGQIVVIDGYNFDTEYMMSVKTKGAKLVVIDDLCDKTYFADLIINHSPAATKEGYNAQTYTKYALGLDYVLLREKFLLQAAQNRTISRISSVLVCFGGADSQNYTLKALQELSDIARFQKIIAITGPSYVFSETLENLIRLDTRIAVKHNLNEEQMIAEMIETDLAITSASGIVFEAVSCGCIPLICITALNQESFHNVLNERFSVLSFGNNIKAFNTEKFKESIGLVTPSLKNEADIIRLRIAEASRKLASIFSLLNYD